MEPARLQAPKSLEPDNFTKSSVDLQEKFNDFSRNFVHFTDCKMITPKSDFKWYFRDFFGCFTLIFTTFDCHGGDSTVLTSPNASERRLWCVLKQRCYSFGSQTTLSCFYWDFLSRHLSDWQLWGHGCILGPSGSIWQPRIKLGVGKLAYSYITNFHQKVIEFLL